MTIEYIRIADGRDGERGISMPAATPEMVVRAVVGAAQQRRIFRSQLAPGRHDLTPDGASITFGMRVHPDGRGAISMSPRQDEPVVTIEYTDGELMAVGSGGM